MTDWQPLETAPWGKVVEVKNEQMDEPVRATRGYVWRGAVHPDSSFFTTVYTPRGRDFPTLAGQLVCPTVWRDLNEEQAA